MSWREEKWRDWTAGLTKTNTDPLYVREQFLTHERDVIRKLHRAGVPFLAGTDTPTGIDLVPGFSLHRELQQLVAEGFTPFEALQTATINPARFLNKRDDFGTVEKGKVADLVLLDGDPSLDIANTQRIAAVVAAGRYLSRGELDRMLKAVETAAVR